MRVRIGFSKIGKIRFTSHRDVARIWERALRRAGIPLAYTEGFSPRPKLAFGLALPTAYESLAEYIDVEVADGADLAPGDLLSLLNPMLPDGMTVVGTGSVERGATSLQQAVTSCSWEMTIPDRDIDMVSAWCDQVLNAPEIVVTRERKGKQVTDDLRPNVVDLSALEEIETGVRFAAELGTQPRALRPSELLTAVEPALPEGLVRRTHQWILTDAGRCEPLAATGGPVPHTEMCA